MSIKRSPTYLADKSQEVFDKVENLSGAQLWTVLSAQLNAISNPRDRAAVQSIVFNMLRVAATSKPPQPTEMLTVNRILGGTFALSFLCAWWEMGLSVVWSGVVSLLVTVVVRFVFRLYDRGFIFRRLFIAFSASGFILIVLPKFEAFAKTDFGWVSLGGPPDGIIVFIWTVAIVITFLGAFWESYVSGRT